MVFIHLISGNVSIMLISLIQILGYSALTLAILLELNTWMQLKCHLKAAVGLIGPVESSKIMDKHLMIYSICFFSIIILNLVAIINSVLQAKNIAEATPERQILLLTTMNILSSSIYLVLFLSFLIVSVWLAFQLQTNLLSPKIVNQDPSVYLKVHRSINNSSIILFVCYFFQILWLLVTALGQN